MCETCIVDYGSPRCTFTPKIFGEGKREGLFQQAAGGALCSVVVDQHLACDQTEQHTETTAKRN